jgi:hypothetical protein
VFHAASLASSREERVESVFLEFMLDAVTDTMRFTRKLLSRAGYWGVCDLGVALRDVRGLRLRMIGGALPRHAHAQVDDVVTLRRAFSAVEWTSDEHLLRVITDTGRDLGWCFGWPLAEDDVASYVRKSEPWRL